MRRSNQSILKEVSPEYSLEGLMLKPKLQYFGTWCKELTHLKRPWCWEILKVGGEGNNEDEMVVWHHGLNGHESGWTSGVGDVQGGLASCSPWGHKELDMTEWVNWNEVDTRIRKLMIPMSFLCGSNTNQSKAVQFQKHHHYRNYLIYVAFQVFSKIQTEYSHCSYV